MFAVCAIICTRRRRRPTAAEAAEPQVSQGPGSRPAKASEQDPALHQPTLGVASSKTNALAPSAMPDASLSACYSFSCERKRLSLARGQCRVSALWRLIWSLTTGLVEPSGSLSIYILSALALDKYKRDAWAKQYQSYQISIYENGSNYHFSYWTTL